MEPVAGGHLSRVRVVTLNVYGPANPDWDRRFPVLRDTLRRLDADVIALQEVPTGSDDVLDELLGEDWHLGHFSQRSDDGVSGTLATRWPQRYVTELDLGVTARSRATLPWCATYVAEVDTPVGTVVLAHHKPSWPFPYELERERQAVLAARALEDHIGDRDVHAIVLGDFDATPDAASMQFWQGRRSLDGMSVCYQSAWDLVHPDDPGRTFDRENPLVRDGEVGTAVSRRIDHVLLRARLHGPTLEVVDCRRVLDKPVGGVWASDHYGVLADLALADPPPGFRS